jgi:hypothetical protein
MALYSSEAFVGLYRITERHIPDVKSVEFQFVCQSFTFYVPGMKNIVLRCSLKWITLYIAGRDSYVNADCEEPIVQVLQKQG